MQDAETASVFKDGMSIKLFNLLNKLGKTKTTYSFLNNILSVFFFKYIFFPVHSFALQEK